MTQFLQQDNAYSYKVKPPNSATPYNPMGATTVTNKDTVSSFNISSYFLDLAPLIPNLLLPPLHSATLSRLHSLAFQNKLVTGYTNLIHALHNQYEFTHT